MYSTLIISPQTQTSFPVVWCVSTTRRSIGSFTAALYWRAAAERVMAATQVISGEIYGRSPQPHTYGAPNWLGRAPAERHGHWLSRKTTKQSDVSRSGIFPSQPLDNYNNQPAIT